MVECKTRYSIKIIVEVGGTQYVSYRNYPDSGCNHVDNIPSVADYMGQEILEKILQPKSGTDLETTMAKKYTTLREGGII